MVRFFCVVHRIKPCWNKSISLYNDEHQCSHEDNQKLCSSPVSRTKNNKIQFITAVADIFPTPLQECTQTTVSHSWSKPQEEDYRNWKEKRGTRKNKEIHKRSGFSQWEKMSKDQDSLYISCEMIHKQVGNEEYIQWRWTKSLEFRKLAFQLSNLLLNCLTF